MVEELERLDDCCLVVCLVVLVDFLDLPLLLDGVDCFGLAFCSVFGLVGEDCFLPPWIWAVIIVVNSNAAMKSTKSRFIISLWFL